MSLASKFFVIFVVVENMLTFVQFAGLLALKKHP